MKSIPRKTHRLLGALLILPCLLWGITGLLFHWKPGWGAAYSSLSVQTYPLREPIQAPQEGWMEMRTLRTILGPHLLVKTAEGWQQRDPNTGSPRPAPPRPDRITLLEDALRADPERYGSLEELEDWTASTSTGVEVTLDWDTMRLSQSGADTRRINLLYKIHYLQWTGTKWGDRVLPLVGLISFILLALLGLRMLLKRGGSH